MPTHRFTLLSLLLGSVALPLAAETAQPNMLTAEEAGAIALAAQLGTIAEAELDSFEGKPAYDVEVVTQDGFEIEFKIDAETGEILNVWTDDDPSDDPTATSGPVLDAAPIGDVLAFIVHQDSDIQSTTDLVDARSRAGQAFALGGGSAPGMDTDEISQFEVAFSKLYDTDAWEDAVLEKNWIEHRLDSAGFAALLDRQAVQIRDALKALE